MQLFSANTSFDAVLAVTETGNFTSEEEIDNPGIKLFFNNAKRIIGGLNPEIPEVPFPERPQMRDWVYEVIEDSVLPRIEVNYGICPNPGYEIVTCNAIAAAQSLSYFERPSSIELTWDNNRHLDINWYAYKHLDSPMCAHEINNCYDFMRELAYRMKTDQQTYASNFGDCHNVLTSILGNKVKSIESNTPNVRNLIKSGGVLIVCGTSKNSAGQLESTGHTWIIDGYKYKYIVDQIYIVTLDKFGGREISRELQTDLSATVTNLVHINWGWSGEDNGYFNFNCLNPAGAVQYDGYHNDANNKNYIYDIYYFLIR